jgi:hypothetical protein
MGFRPGVPVPDAARQPLEKCALTYWHSHGETANIPGVTAVNGGRKS